MRILTTICLLVTLLVLGCGSEGPKLGKVSGTLMIDGKPGSNIRINFRPVGGGRTSSALTDANGNYELVYSQNKVGAVVGEHVVNITAPEPAVDMGSSVSSENLNQSDAFPQKYRDTTQTVTVESGSNTIDISFP